MPFLLLMPSFNQAHYIGAAVSSVLGQDDPDWQLWILDNSTDDTPEVMSQFKDARIHYRHIPTRMDPGSCLNWMLAHTNGELFSYLHTDNNLHPTYVRRMKEALTDHPLGLAYCDMRVIDGHGERVKIFRRGSFDLSRLLSLDTLGVPFAATTEVARRIGGFKEGNFADDVHFCISAYGTAEFIHVREPIIEYRIHTGSRTENAGGSAGMQKVFLRELPKAARELELKGLHPQLAMAQTIKNGLDDFEWFVEDLWYRKLSRIKPKWWSGEFKIEYLFEAGLLSLPNLEPGISAPNARLFGRDAQAHLINPLREILLRSYLKTRSRELRRLITKPLQVLLPWACLTLNAEPDQPQHFRIRALNFRTLWVARQLEVHLGWKPLLDEALSSPSWLRWRRAQGTEPLLECTNSISLA